MFSVEVNVAPGLGPERVTVGASSSEPESDPPEPEPDTGGLKPYVLVRGRLEALVSRALFYDLVALGVIEGEWFGVWSSGRFWPMQRAVEIGAVPQ